MRLAGLVLAGGLGSRLGADVPKPLVEVGGRSCLERALACLRPRCTPLLVSANDAAAFAGLDLELVADRRAARLGPLAGLEAAARRLRETRSSATHLLCAPGDTPFLPADLVERLTAGSATLPRIARHEGRRHPTVALWPLPALGALSARLDGAEADLSLMSFLSATGFEAVDFPGDAAAPGGDPFFNINTPDDLATARDRLRL